MKLQLNLSTRTLSHVGRCVSGIDTRFGWGFRLGQHVDYQSLVEIGPQTNTNPISSNGTAAVAKRQSITLSRIERLNKESLKNGEKQAENERLQKKQGKDKKPYTAQNVEFKKVPGIDEDINRRKSGPKSSKQEKPYVESAPTKFSLL